MVLERIADFLRQLLTRHDELKQGHQDMSADLKTIIAKLTDQGAQIDAQGAQIDKLIAERDAKEQADLDTIDTLLDANAAKSSANATKITGALGVADAGSSTVTVSSPVTAPATTIPVTTDAPVATGSTVVGPGINVGTTVTSSDESSITLSTPTVGDHAGGETLTVAAPTT